jgi:hypothetical protein
VCRIVSLRDSTRSERARTQWSHACVSAKAGRGGARTPSSVARHPPSSLADRVLCSSQSPFVRLCSSCASRRDARDDFVLEDLEREEYLTRIAFASLDGLCAVNSCQIRGFTQFILVPDRGNIVLLVASLCTASHAGEALVFLI